MRSLLIAPLAALCLFACSTTPREDPFAADRDAPQASIAFSEFGSIRSFRPQGRDAVLLESSHNRWYRATFFGTCSDLPFTESVGVLSRGGSTSRFEGLIVRGQRCPFRTLVEAPDPDAPAAATAPETPPPPEE